MSFVVFLFQADKLRECTLECSSIFEVLGGRRHIHHISGQKNGIKLVTPSITIFGPSALHAQEQSNAQPWVEELGGKAESVRTGLQRNRQLGPAGQTPWRPAVDLGNQSGTRWPLLASCIVAWLWRQEVSGR